MLRRLSEHDDPELLRELPLQPRLEEAPRTGVGLPSLRIGRHPNNDVVLTSAGIPLLLSRQHALVTYDGEQFTLVDLDTTNGTYVRPCAAAAARGRLGRALQPPVDRAHETHWVDSAATRRAAARSAGARESPRGGVIRARVASSRWMRPACAAQPDGPLGGPKFDVPPPRARR